MILQYNVDGVIVASSMLPPQFAEACAEAGLPVVQAFGRPGAAANVHVVGADNVQGGRLAGRLLTERGYRRIAFLGGPATATSTEDRLRGFRQSLKRAGIAPVSIVFAASYAHEAGAERMRELLADTTIDAVFCGDDILAMGAIDACRDAGIRVPRDLGIIGFNDFAMAAWPAYRLTTIRQPIPDIIVAAVDMVLDIVDATGPREKMHVFRCVPAIRGTLRETAPAA
jgi:DNA-binding LacI/PurR family transcriptional regulator